MSAVTKLRNFAHDLVREDYPLRVRALRVGQRLVNAAGVQDRYGFALGQNDLVELSKPPRKIGGMRDLVVRRATREDAAEVGAIDDTPIDEVHRRLERGDLAYLGISGDEIMCKTWFYRGNAPFSDYDDKIASWALGPRTFWSYNATSAPAAMATGVFVKMFSVALGELFTRDGADRVVGTIRDTNTNSMRLHEYLGWSRLGTLISVLVPGLRWLHWHDANGRDRQWVAPRTGRPFVLRVPPA